MARKRHKIHKIFTISANICSRFTKGDFQMKIRFGGLIAIAFVIVTIFFLIPTSATAQSAASKDIPRLPNGKPDFSGKMGRRYAGHRLDRFQWKDIHRYSRAPIQRCASCDRAHRLRGSAASELRDYVGRSENVYEARQEHARVCAHETGRRTHGILVHGEQQEPPRAPPAGSETGSVKSVGNSGDRHRIASAIRCLSPAFPTSARPRRCISRPRTCCSPRTPVRTASMWDGASFRSLATTLL